MISVKVRSRCSICGFEVKWIAYVNADGFFQISEAYCPNDFGILTQEINGKDAENKWLEDKRDDNKRRSQEGPASDQKGSG